MIRRTIKVLAGIGDSPKRTAFAFAVGVFLGFSPLIGLQTLVGLAAAFLFRLNRLAVVVGTLLNLPWLMPAYYAFAGYVGHQLIADRSSTPVEMQISTGRCGGHGILKGLQNAVRNEARRRDGRHSGTHAHYGEDGAQPVTAQIRKGKLL